MILRFLFYAFLIYLAYKLVVDLIIPVYRTTRRIKMGVREMQEHLRQQQQGTTGPTSNNIPPHQTRETTGKGDYIEFEEIK